MPDYKFIKVVKSNTKGKKYDAIFKNLKTNREKKVSFGSAGMSDYTLHKDPERKKRYITRHQKREKWGDDGILTAGWWSRWLLWNFPSYNKSLQDVRSKLKSAGY